MWREATTASQVCLCDERPMDVFAKYEDSQSVAPRFAAMRSEGSNDPSPNPDTTLPGVSFTDIRTDEDILTEAARIFGEGDVPTRQIGRAHV